MGLTHTTEELYKGHHDASLAGAPFTVNGSPDLRSKNNTQREGIARTAITTIYIYICVCVCVWRA
jgi:hypothetical protein